MATIPDSVQYGGALDGATWAPGIPQTVVNVTIQDRNLFINHYEANYKGLYSVPADHSIYKFRITRIDGGDSGAFARGGKVGDEGVLLIPTANDPHKSSGERYLIQAYGGSAPSEPLIFWTQRGGSAIIAKQTTEAVTSTTVGDRVERVSGATGGLIDTVIGLLTTPISLFGGLIKNLITLIVSIFF